MGKLGRKGGAFPHSGAAEPHGVQRLPANLDSLGQRPPLKQGAALPISPSSPAVSCSIIFYEIREVTPSGIYTLLRGNKNDS